MNGYFHFSLKHEFTMNVEYLIRIRGNVVRKMKGKGGECKMRGCVLKIKTLFSFGLI